MSNESPILEREAELRRAQLSGDVETLDRLLDDALVATALDGSVIAKGDDLSLHRSGRMRIIKLDPVEQFVLNLGTTAIVNVRMEAEAIIDGVNVAATLRYTRVWYERLEGWRVVAAHMSTVQTQQAVAVDHA